MIATLLQLLGLAGVVAAGIIEFGAAGGIAGGAVAAIYIGLAMDGEN